MAKSIYSIYGVDKEKEQRGIVVSIGDGITFRLARLSTSNSAYAGYIKNEFKKHKYQVETDTLPEEIENNIALSAFVKYIILDWDGVYDLDGKEIPYSEENAEKLMKDMPDLYKSLSSTAANFSNFLREERQKTAKNSENA